MKRVALLLFLAGWLVPMRPRRIILQGGGLTLITSAYRKRKTNMAGLVSTRGDQGVLPRHA